MLAKGDLVTWAWRVENRADLERQMGIYLETLSHRESENYTTFKVWTSRGIRYPKCIHSLKKAL